MASHQPQTRIEIVQKTSPVERSGAFWLRQGNDQDWQGTLKVNDDDLTGFRGFFVALPPLSSGKLVLTGGEQLAAGYLEIDPGEGSSILDVAISFFYNFHDAQGNLIDSVSIPPPVFSHDEYVLPVERSAKVNTGFAWCPSYWDPPFNLVMTLYAQDGSLFQQKQVTLEGHAAQFFTDVFANVPADFIGMIRFQSEAGRKRTAAPIMVFPGNGSESSDSVGWYERRLPNTSNARRFGL